MRTDDASMAPTSPSIAPTLLAAAIWAAATAAMGWAASTLLPDARTAHGASGLLSWVLVLGAGCGVLLCAYLTLVWTMAGTVVMVGPASSTGRALLAALRVLAPRLARRSAATAAVATATTGLVLVPASAAMTTDDADPGAVRMGSMATTEPLSPAGGNPQTPPGDGVGHAPAPSDGGSDHSPAPGDGPGEAPAAADGGSPSGADDSLPSLGWGGADDPDPGPDDPRSPTTVPTDTHDGRDGAPDDGPADSELPATVTVHPGDSLWSITDELLGPAPDLPSEVSAAWPLLHDANREVIGPDPSRIQPGQVLDVPASLSPQESS